jgi:hypothetical protein
MSNLAPIFRHAVELLPNLHVEETQGGSWHSIGQNQWDRSGSTGFYVSECDGRSLQVTTRSGRIYRWAGHNDCPSHLQSAREGWYAVNCLEVHVLVIPSLNVGEPV